MHYLTSLLLPTLTKHDTQLLTTYLERSGCDCITATNGLQALEAYKQSVGNIDLVFMGTSPPPQLFNPNPLPPYLPSAIS